MIDSEPRLVRMLLGDIGEDERREIELRFLEDETAFADLLALEDELRFEYLQGRLSRDDRARFERRYLVTDEDRAKLAFARALLQRSPADAPSAPATVRVAWWRHPALQFGLAAAALVLAVSSAWLLWTTRRLEREIDTLRAAVAQIAPASDEARRLSEELARERTRREQLEQQLAATTTTTPGSPLLSLLLTPGLSRSGGDEVPRADPGSVQRGLRLDLKMPTDARAATYRVALRDADGRALWSGADVQRRGTVATVTIPPSVLTRGDYEIVLRTAGPRGASEDLASYYFSVR